jgi:hypothetical protein
MLGSSLIGLIDRIEVKSHSKSQSIPDSTSYSLSDSNLEIAVYKLHMTDDMTITVQLMQTTKPSFRWLLGSFGLQ